MNLAKPLKALPVTYLIQRLLDEKITYSKLDADTPKFIVQFDATIVAPLIFAWILDW